MEENPSDGAQDRALSNIVYLKVPEALCTSFGEFRLDPSIPLPVETAGTEGSFTSEELSKERILAGMLKILAFKAEDPQLDYYRSFIRAVRPGLFAELSSAGVEQAKAGDSETAYEIFLAMAGLEPERPEPLLCLAELFEQRADAERRAGHEESSERLIVSAFSAFKRAMGLDSAGPDVFYQAGRFYLKEKEFSRARELLETSVKLGLDKERAQLAQDLVRKLGSQEKLDGLFKEAYDFIRMGKEEEGIQKIGGFLKAYPEVWNGWFLLGWGLRRLSRWDDARVAFEKALKLSGEGPDAVDSLNELSICLLELGDYAGARKRLETALRIEPENVKIISNLGMLSLKNGKTEEARRFFLTALEIAPDDPLATRLLQEMEG